MVDAIAAVQAWIVANETVAAEHNAMLMEEIVEDHLRDTICQLGNKTRENRQAFPNSKNSITPHDTLNA